MIIRKGVYVEVGLYKGEESYGGFKNTKKRPLLYIGSADERSSIDICRQVEGKIAEIRRKGIEKVI
jgi:hypothetical protein